MNQIFSPSRFLKYAAYQYRMRSKILLLIVGGASVALLFINLYSIIRTSSWNEQNWIQQFFIVGVIGSVLYIGSSFPYLRKKESTYNYLMLPVSVFEKIVYEFSARVLFFIVFYPALFYLLSNLTVSFAQLIFPGRTFFYFSFDFITKHHGNDFYVHQFLFALYLLLISAFFAGAVIARKYPLLKTLVVIGLFYLIIYYFFFVMIEKMDLGYGFSIINDKYVKSDFRKVPSWVYISELIGSLLIYVYAYFKLKEKEV